MKPEIDLLSVANFAGEQPHDQFRWLRENEPVYFHDEPDGPGFWAVTRYEDVKEVGRDTERFSSSPTIMIQDPAEENSFGPDNHMMLMTDPPLHTSMRKLVSAEFTPRAAAKLTPRITELAGQIVDAVATRGNCDLVTDVAGEMPSFVIAEMLGIPLEHGRKLYHLTEAMHSSSEVMSHDKQREALEQMMGYAMGVYAEKVDQPVPDDDPEDLSTLIINGVIDDRPIDAVNFALWFLLLVDAGGDTTRNLVGGGIHALLQHPDQLAALVADPDAMLPRAIEELLRWVSPVVYMRRSAVVDTHIGETAIKKGDKVVMYYGSANRDGEIFDDPESFDITRQPNPHVAFGGGGAHYCLGAHLARIEIKALLREALTRLGDLKISGDVSWMGSNFVFGPSSMPVTFASTA